MITFRWDFVMSDCFDFSSVFTCFNLSYPFIQKKWVKLLLSSLALWFQLAKEIIKTILTNILGSVCHLAKCGHNIHHFFHAVNELASVCVPRCFSHVRLFATPWTILHPWDSPRKNTGGVAMSSYTGSSWLRDLTMSLMSPASGFFTTSTTWEAQMNQQL